MNTQKLNQFETMDTETLATIEGGMTWSEIGAIVGATIGSFYIPNPVIVPFRVR
ncbi:Blp family class II bacteriocin [Streptococcus mutans]|uniref:Blp family class II bacteriocin n=1 Tax=Streptococcus mutans TaxID=1309 RepID=UPI0002F32F8C|nr:Blp family class II bacteriocin [Streptococcus mutans]